MYTTPLSLTARPIGVLKRAFVPAPSAVPAAVVPASVVTTPVAVVIALMTLFIGSVMYRLP